LASSSTNSTRIALPHSVVNATVTLRSMTEKG